jgi:hypothetical protein
VRLRETRQIAFLLAMGYLPLAISAATVCACTSSPAVLMRVKLSRGTCGYRPEAPRTSGPEPTATLSTRGCRFEQFSRRRKRPGHNRLFSIEDASRPQWPYPPADKCRGRTVSATVRLLQTRVFLFLLLRCYEVARRKNSGGQEENSSTLILPRDRGLREYGDSHINMTCRPA